MILQNFMDFSFPVQNSASLIACVWYLQNFDGYYVLFSFLFKLF